MASAHILVVDRDPELCREDHEIQLTTLLKRALPTIAVDVKTIRHYSYDSISTQPNLIFLRYPLTEDLSQMVKALRRIWDAIPILGLFCAHRDTPAAARCALLDSLDDFLSCPIRAIDLSLRVFRLMPSRHETTTTRQAGEVQAAWRVDGMVGESVPFRQVIQKILTVASSDATVLLTGETGTGKELVARAIHYQSLRQNKPFVPVNCGALPDHLVENELFGHARGAYTDASSPETGLVAASEGGTLFLDEVDTLSASAQVKLLRFLQDCEYRPVGSAKRITANVRIIAATNADLWQHVQAKWFREDLYYRLYVLALRLPPLRERTDDIPRLAIHFLRHYGNQYNRDPQHFSAATLHKLMRYAWPGNVRELETTVQRAVLLTSSSVLHPDDIELSGPHPTSVVEKDSFCEAKARVIAQFERTYLINLLSAHGGNITHAAKQAGKERRAFTRLMQKYGLQRRAFQA